MPQATQNPLRAVFAGIGRILSVTDKVRNKPATAEAPAASPAPETTAPESAAPEAAATEAAGTAPTAEAGTADTAAAETEAPEAEATPATDVEAEAAPKAEAAPEAAEPKAAATASEDLPLPNYGELTIASVRARLRNLSVTQLNTLIEHEKANAGREDFISMFKRRIAKVESGK